MKYARWRRRIALAVMLGWLSCLVLAAQPDPVRFGLAVEQGQLEKVKAWLEAGLKADFLSDRGSSGLMIAAWEGNVDMMALFFEHGAQIDLANQYDEQALQLAAWRGHLEAVQWLLGHGASLNRPGRWSALHYAVFADQKEVAELLLERGAQIDARAPNGSTVLMMAAREGREGLARRLLDAGADPGVSNESGDSALTWAMRHEHFKIARMVSTAAEFAKAAQAAPESFGARVRSVAAPSEIEEILRRMRLAQAAGQPVEALRKSLFEAVARFKQGSQQLVIGKPRPGKAGRRGKPQALVITAKRGQASKSGSERAELVYPGGSGEVLPMAGNVTEILEQMARARAAGKPLGQLRQALLEAVERFKKEAP